MDISTIRAMELKAAKTAAAQNKVPYVPFDTQEVDRWTSFPFPALGSYRPKGWKLIEDWLVDATGMGLESEPVLTIPALKHKISDLIIEGKEYGYAIISCGQFRVVVGVFEKLTPTPATKTPTRKRKPTQEVPQAA